ncbi:MAG: signal peptide peptidase SppA [Bacteroidota bacterium]|nr:signal peptide peptidase SppA [Bacteroidota bacterium]MDP4259529.1 signal peptide peptidase SppA [Bacteroidota bacterium]
MWGFFKSFFAALLAFIVFVFAAFCFLIGMVSGLTSSRRPSVGQKAVLVLDLSQTFREQARESALSFLTSSDDEFNEPPGLYDLVRLLHHARGDSAIKGLYIKCNNNPNGFASSEEIRNALLDFKRSGKFIYAFGDAIPQKAYYVASVADRIYCNPKGGVDWKGFAIEMPFLKGALEKLEIEPQIFYAGKFKSATEPLRADKMTEPNRLQLTELLDGFFNTLLYSTAASRGLDTTVLRKCADGHLIRYAADALAYRLVDGLRYDDEVKEEIHKRLHGEDHDFINFVTFGKYARAVNYKASGKDAIYLIYAEGDIVNGKGEKEEIGADTYRWLIRKARYDDDCKAIVIRVNSGGGSSLASENLWREIYVARKTKPVILSFGDVAASGGYYLSCNADSIFAEPTTITGSIGVFSVIPNLQSFFRNKLGVTFDNVKTSPDAGELTVTRPLTPSQKMYMQNEVDSIYHDFKYRVADGRKLTIDYVDSIGQGRVWSGRKGLQLGLVDRLGGLQDAIDCAARMAKTKSYSLKELPEPRNLLELLTGGYRKSILEKSMKEQLGEDGYRTYNAIRRVKAMTGITQARMPFDPVVE